MTRGKEEQDIVGMLDSVDSTSFHTDADRYAAKEAARRLLSRLETPFERGWALAFENPVLVAGLQVGLDLGIWERWALEERQSNGAPQKLRDIVSWCNAAVELNVIRRFFRHIAALYLLEETGEDEWRLTSYTTALGDQSSYAGQIIRCGLDHTIPAGVNFPGFLQKNHYRDPLVKEKLDNYTDMTGGTDFFTTCAKDPERLGSSFIGMMTALRNHKMSWTDVYDTTDLVFGADLTNGSPLFVDVGGAHGLDSARLLERHPELPSDVLIVQDTPEVIVMDVEPLDPRITKMAYDFFKEQPVKGSRAYFFHAVPHDWPDQQCVRMFEMVKAAMVPGYSKLLIYEIVLPAEGATSLMTTLDLQLMSCVSGLERTEEHWSRLLGQAGFKISSVSKHPRAIESVIEAEIA